VEAVMKYSSIVLAAVLVLVSGCADHAGSDSPSASPTFAGKAQCERNRGVWRANLGLCETSKGFEKVNPR